METVKIANIEMLFDRPIDIHLFLVEHIDLPINLIRSIQRTAAISNSVLF